MRSPLALCGPCGEPFVVAANAYTTRFKAGLWLVGVAAPCCGRLLAAPVDFPVWLAIRRLVEEFDRGEVALFRRELEAAGPAAAALIGQPHA